jgi:hypothetical protein
MFIKQFAVLFEPYKNTDITIRECVDMYDNEGTCTVLSNGEVIGFTL